MMRIFKYALDLAPSFAVPMPEGAVVLSVQAQNGAPYVWALVDDTAPAKSKFFIWFGTGHPIEKRLLGDLNFIGTVQLNEFVFHLFERIR
jgi:hypothetical protein